MGVRGLMERIIVCLFLLLICLPTVQMNFKIWDTDILEERRPKAGLPALTWESFTEGSFMDKFESYFADNLGFRDRLIKLNTKADRYLFLMSSNIKVILGKEDYLFYHETLDDYNKQPTINDETIAEIAVKIATLQRKLENRGIIFLFFIGPNKNTIYPEYMPSPSQNVNGQSNYDRLIHELEKNHVNFVNLAPVFYKNKDKYQLYYKRDTHWNLTGATIATQEIIKNISGKSGIAVSIPSIRGFREMTPEEFDGYDLNIMLGLEKTYKTVRQLPIIDYGNVSAKLPATLWYGDSFSGGITPQYSNYCADVTFYYYNQASLVETLPQHLVGKKVVVLEVVERYIPTLVTLLAKPVL